MTLGADRVAASRERLRNAMAPKKPPPRPAAARGRASSWLDDMRQSPAVSIVLDSINAWWSRHPMRHVARVAEEATDAAVRPIAQRNPVLLVAGAGALGAALGWLRPWRWLFGSAVFAGVMPQVASHVLSRLPIESWLGVIGSTLSGRRSSRRPDATRPQRFADPLSTPTVDQMDPRKAA